MFDEGEKYNGPIPQIKYLPTHVIEHSGMAGEVRSVSDDVAKKMDFSQPVNATAFRYDNNNNEFTPSVNLSDGHHRLAAAKQTGVPHLPVNLVARNAKGGRLNALKALSDQIEKNLLKQKFTKAEGGEVDEPGITAYHGSPHDFENFDMSKIGTGEGNQSYGHGLYFAQNEDVAKGYRDTLGGHHPGDVLIGDEKHPHWASRDVINAYRKLGYDNETAVMASHFIKEHKGDLNAAAAATWSNDKIPDSVADAIFKTEYATPAGHMYEVHIKAHPDHFLDWDKPFHEQSEHVKRGLRSIPEFDDRVARYGVLDPSHKSKISMGEFINRGVLPHSYDKSGPEFSNAYRAAGIKGVKYLDQGSRWGDKKTPTRNYVVFDDKLVNVKRKYAKGGSVDEYPLDADADEHKHSGGHMSWMSPDTFLDKAEKMQGDSDDKHAVKHFEKRIKEGDKLNPLALYPKGGQDGRHRATAAKHLGIDEIPVVQWPKKRGGGSIVQRALMLTSKKA